MATIDRTRKLDRELTLHLYHAPGEQNRPDDLRAALRGIGLESGLLRKNPVTHDVWKLVLDLAQNHGQHAAIGAALLGVIKLWLKQTKGRGVEIARPGFKVKAASARELEKTLMALHNYDELAFTLNNGKHNLAAKKAAVTKRASKS